MDYELSLTVGVAHSHYKLFTMSNSLIIKLIVRPVRNATERTQSPPRLPTRTIRIRVQNMERPLHSGPAPSRGALPSLNSRWHLSRQRNQKPDSGSDGIAAARQGFYPVSAPLAPSTEAASSRHHGLMLLPSPALRRMGAYCETIFLESAKVFQLCALWDLRPMPPV